VNLSDRLTIVPFIHGRVAFGEAVRMRCLSRKYDCIAVDLPAVFSDDLIAAVEELPIVSAVIASGIADPVYYVPCDPCDATIEAVRQARQNRLPCEFIGHPLVRRPPPAPAMPDEYAIKSMGFDAYAALCVSALGVGPLTDEEEEAAAYTAHRLHDLESDHAAVLAVVHLRHFSRAVFHYGRESSHNRSFEVPPLLDTRRMVINPDHLYFALGELPFITGRFEKARLDPFSADLDLAELVKELFRETRDEYFDDEEQVFALSPARLQTALTFLRNLTVMGGCLVPSLFDIVEAAKGVGGNSYAVRIIRAAKYYPYFPVEGDETVEVGIDKLILPGESNPRECVNLFRDTATTWRTVAIRPDPTLEKRRQYRYRWNPAGMCSHVPEDRRIESFNAHIRKQARRVLVEDQVKVEKLTTSLRDGIDIRETLRHWFDRTVYVKEVPPDRGAFDTVVIIFDEDHDEKYPHCATWYAEHAQESTLTFYGTDPFTNLVGPGVARAHYGGLSLLFPPRPVPNIFELTKNMELKNNAERLAYGGMLFSGEKNVAYVAARRPDITTVQLSRKLGKHLVWIPISKFSTETLRKLRRFHVLNGKEVRSWAARFIGE
jgi:hypothetical protein